MIRSMLRFCIAIFVCSIFISTPLLAWSADNIAPSTVKAKKPAAKSKKAESAAETTAEQDKKAEDAFTAFTQDWMQKLQQHGQYGIAKVSVQEDPNQKGSYIATYTDLSEPKEVQVKKTGNKASPYVGTLKYEKNIFLSSGNNPEEVKKGPFHPGTGELVSEIFRYSKGEWLF